MNSLSADTTRVPTLAAMHSSHPDSSPRRWARRGLTATLTVSLCLAAAPVAGATDEALDSETTTTAATTTTTAPATTTTTAPATTTTTAPSTTTTPSTVPLLAPAPAPAPAAQNILARPAQLANILATIRYVESRGDYSAPPNRGRASGAYQFITSTWNRYAGYPEAYLAPPEIQDERAAQDVIRFLQQWNNDVSMIPVMWYYPRAASDVMSMDIVPVPSAGNVLTVREYQQRWLAVWAFLSGQAIPQPLSPAQALGRLGLPPELPDPVPVEPGTPAVERHARVAFPVLGPARIATPECGDAQNVEENAGAGADDTAAEFEAAGLCAEEAPSIVFGVQLQPVLSVTDGVVTAVENEPGSTIAVTVTDITGRSYRLAGFNDDNIGTDDAAAPPHLRLTPLARVGATVRAGQVLGFMGNSSPLPLGVREDVPTDATVTIRPDTVAPHIRLTIRDLDGSPVDAYGPVIDALFTQACSVGTGPWSGPPTGVLTEPVVIETTDNDRTIDSEWIITASGQVTAAGWAAMIYPSENCRWAPALPHGPGASGATQVPVDWLSPIVLATHIWIELAHEPDAARAIAPLARP
jgi:hypothetical protein